MKRRIAIISAIIFVSLQTIPCGNSYRRSENLDVYTQGNTLEVFKFRQNFDRSSLLEELRKLGDVIKTGLNLFEDENDKALTYMRVGEYDKALDILKRLEKEKPAEYNIIANLGTLYELMGENEKALGYIRKAVSLNNDSHHGSEWFHIQVLEAKILKKKEAWWKTHTVLDLTAIKKDTETIISDITYQLKERLPFTPKPDIMMASILNQTGEFLRKHSKDQQAWIIYKIATEYDKDSSFGLSRKMADVGQSLSKKNLPLPDYNAHFIKTDELLETGKQLLDKGIELYTKQQATPEKEKKKDKTSFVLLIIGGSALVLSLVYFLIRKRKQ